MRRRAANGSLKGDSMDGMTRFGSAGRAGAALVAAAALTIVAPHAHADLEAAIAPGGNFALNHWSLTVPADTPDGTSTSGEAVTIDASDLKGSRGYQANWFYTDADGAMTFWTPVDGATTGGSSHPRSELREQLVSGLDSHNWNGSGTSILDAQLKIISVPSDGIVIVGQVHGYGVAPLVLVYYRYDPAAQSGALIAKFQTYPVQGPPYQVHTLASGIKLGRTFRYRIRVAQNVASASYNDGTPATMAMDPSWNRETLCFKAGAYLHMAGGSADEGAEVRFYRLAASHPDEGLFIATPSALADGAAGVAYAAQLSAGGGSGRYTWTLVSGKPPAGLTLGKGGTIGGTLATTAVSATPHDFMAIVCDTHGNTAAKKFSILVR
jgi:hypothetical protein